MAEFEAIYGVFINKQEEVLLFQRTWKRTYRKGKWDLMGGEIQDDETPEESFKREALEKLGLNVPNYSVIETPIRLWEQTGIGIRHCFVSRDPIEEITLDSRKYRRYEWVDRNGIIVPTVPVGISAGIRKVLIHVGFIN